MVRLFFPPRFLLRRVQTQRVPKLHLETRKKRNTKINPLDRIYTLYAQYPVCWKDSKVFGLLDETKIRPARQNRNPPVCLIKITLPYCFHNQFALIAFVIGNFFSFFISPPGHFQNTQSRRRVLFQRDMTKLCPSANTFLWAAAPLLQDLFFHLWRNFSSSFFSSFKAEIPASKLKSESQGSELTLKAHIPVTRLKSQSQGSNPSLKAERLKAQFQGSNLSLKTQSRGSDPSFGAQIPTLRL